MSRIAESPGHRQGLEISSVPDRVFSVARDARDFAFTQEVAAVFDDMVERSVPYYGEMQRLICEVAAEFAVPDTQLYDLGCSTATTLLMLDGVVKPGVRFVGVDNSEPMLQKARMKLDDTGVSHQTELLCADLHEGPAIENASVVTMILTLQFVRPLYRERLVRRIADGMLADGCLLLVEKQTLEHTLLNRLFIKHYYAYKRRNGYSELEISQKREALENVLIPYRPDENRKLLLDCGFRHVEEIFRWYNFAALVAVK